jgi:guanine nucleotide-binding protein alpha-1 subunit
MSEKARGKLPMGAPVPAPTTNGAKPGHASLRSVRFSAQPQANVSLTDVHRRTRERLLPLLAIEVDMTRKLFPELAPSISAKDEGDGANGAKISTVSGVKEVCVRAGNGWKDALVKLQKEQKDKLKGKENSAGTTDELTIVLDNCRDDIVSLWEDKAVRAVLKRRNVRMQDMPGLWVIDSSLP